MHITNIEKSVACRQSAEFPECPHCLPLRTLEDLENLENISKEDYDKVVSTEYNMIFLIQMFVKILAVVSIV